MLLDVIGSVNLIVKSRVRTLPRVELSQVTRLKLRCEESNAHQPLSTSPAARLFNTITTLVSKAPFPASIYFLTLLTLVFHGPSGCILWPCPGTSSCGPAYRHRVGQRAKTSKREETESGACVTVPIGSSSYSTIIAGA